MATSKKTTTRKTGTPTTRKAGAALAATAKDYPTLLAEVKARIQSAQYAALRAVNKELVGLYWDIGRLIVERQETEGWGKGVVEQLSADLRATFPAWVGFRRRTSGTCASSFRNTAPRQNSNHWLEKSAGRTTCSSCRAARKLRSASSTCA